MRQEQQRIRAEPIKIISSLNNDTDLRRKSYVKFNV